MKTKRRYAPAILLAAIVASAFLCTAANGANNGFGQISGSVIDKGTGEPVPGAIVNILGEMTRTDFEGKFLFKNVPLTHNSLLSYRVSNDDGVVIGCATLDVPVGFMPISAEVEAADQIGMDIVEVASGEPVTLKVSSVSINDIEGFCHQCHLVNPCIEQESFGAVVEEGRDLRGVIVKNSQVEDFEKQLLQDGMDMESYRKLRYQDTHPDAVVMDYIVSSNNFKYAGLYRKPPDLKLTDTSETTCDTCHTRHRDSVWGMFLKMSYEEDSSLCYQCHL